MKNKNQKYRVALAACFGAGLAPAILIYFFRHSLEGWRLDGKQDLLWEMVLKAVAGYVSIIGAVITAFKYIDEKSRQRHQDRIAEQRQKEIDRKTDERQRALDRKEERRVFLQERQAVYRRIGLSLARIMNRDPNDNDWVDAKAKFFELYWGEIPLVADDEVMDLIQPFAVALHGIRTNPEKEDLKDMVYAITDGCRRSLGEAWGDLSESDKIITR